MKLLLPYAYDCNGNLVHIDYAKKGEKYFCPICGVELMLKISKIPKDQKYHRRNHFAHKGNSDNQCSESFLHKLFKDKCVELIRERIANNDPINFVWHCEICEEEHVGNLLKKAVRAEVEYDLGTCKPDIALLDKNGKVVIVVEVVVTHKPEPEVMRYYDEHKIACLQIQVNDFSDCDRIEEKLSHPDRVNRCPNPKCEKCRQVMNHVRISTFLTNCWKCGKEMKVAMLIAKNGTPRDFNEVDVRRAMAMGVKIENRYGYFANICNHCNSPYGEFYMHEFYYEKPEGVSEYYYKCLNCGS